MLIDFLTERYSFSRSGLLPSILISILAAVGILILRRWGQLRSRKKAGLEVPSLWRTILSDLAGGCWAVLFFTVTGCLKGPLDENEKTEDKTLNRKIFFGGVLYPLLGAVAAFVLYTAFQFLVARLPSAAWEIPLLATKTLMGAGLSSVWFSLLPFPGSDAEVFLRTKPFGKRGEAFRKNGTWPFFCFCAVGLLLACVTLPLPGGACSLSGVITLFPVLLIGG